MGIMRPGTSGEQQWSKHMTAGEILFLSMVGAAFVAFSIVLAWSSTGAPGPDEPKPDEPGSGS